MNAVALDSHSSTPPTNRGGVDRQDTVTSRATVLTVGAILRWYPAEAVSKDPIGRAIDSLTPEPISSGDFTESQDKHEPQPVDERILRVHPLGIECQVVDIRSKRGLNLVRTRDEIDAALFSGRARWLDVDPFAYVSRITVQLSEAQIKARDEAWNTIRPIIEAPDGAAFDPRRRGELVKQAAERTGKSKKYIYDKLRRYWQRGQTLNALAPDFDDRGKMHGRPRGIKDTKRGRPTEKEVTDEITGQITVVRGVNVDEAARQCIAAGARQFLTGPHRSRTWTGAYQRTNELYFNRGWEIKDGVWDPLLKPEGERPTLGQFVYWARRSIDELALRQGMVGARREALRHRELTGDPDRRAFGSGSVFQVDSAIGDVHLISELMLKLANVIRLVGKPVITLATDQFSRLICGFDVSLEGPSFETAARALRNAAEDKVAFCARYGITITEDEWPCAYLPLSVLADRGELEGPSANVAVTNCGIHIANTPPFRADWKGIVERNFKTINDMVVKWLPGAVYKQRERGDPDYRLEAMLTLELFRELMIRLILAYNRRRMDPRWVTAPPEFTADGLELTPRDLWLWGMENRGGSLITRDQETLRRNLLPVFDASITERGIQFKSRYYTCETAERERWYARVRGLTGTHRKKVKVACDHRNPDEIFIYSEDGRSMERCWLMEKVNTPDTRLAPGLDLYEVIDFYALRTLKHQAALGKQEQSTAELNAGTDDVVRRAREGIKGAEKESKAAKLGNSRLHRGLENAVDRERERRQREAALPPAPALAAATTTTTNDVAIDEPDTASEPRRKPSSRIADMLRSTLPTAETPEEEEIA